MAELQKKIASKYYSASELIDSQITIKGKNVLDIGTSSGARAIKFQQKKLKKL